MPVTYWWETITSANWSAMTSVEWGIFLVTPAGVDADGVLVNTGINGLLNPGTL